MLLVQIFRSPKPRFTNIFYYVTRTQLQKKNNTENLAYCLTIAS